jgi:aldehyde dehydrogenase (NAD+)
VKSKSGETLSVINPATDEKVTDDVQVAGPEDIDAAVAAAKAAFKGPWKNFTGAQRAKCMNKFADLLDENIDELARLEAIAMGQPVLVAKAFINLCSPGWRCKRVRASFD